MQPWDQPFRNGKIYIYIYRKEGPGESMDTSELSGKSSGSKMTRTREFPGSPLVKT